MAYQRNATEEVQRNVMNTGNVVLCLWHAASRSHFTHIFTFTSLHALLWMLSFHNPQVCVDSGRADTWETDPKAPVLEESLCLGLSTKLFAPDAHWCETEGDGKILCKRVLE